MFKSKMFNDNSLLKPFQPQLISEDSRKSKMKVKYTEHLEIINCKLDKIQTQLDKLQAILETQTTQKINKIENIILYIFNFFLIIALILNFWVK